MLTAKKCQPHCPATDCSGGSEDHLHKFPRKLIQNATLERMRAIDNETYRCSYCSLVWAQSNTRMLGVDPLPLGYYESLDHPGFVPSTQIKIRESKKTN